MDLLRFAEAFAEPAAPQAAAVGTTRPDAADGALVGRVGSEVAQPLTRALDRLHAFASTGRIDRSGLRALHDDIDRARRAGLRAQQIARLASRGVAAPPQRHGLPQALREALARRARESDGRGIELRQDLQPVEVLIDGALLQDLLQTLIDWCFEHARSPVDLRIDRRPWPPHARLQARFVHVPPDESPADAAAAALDCVAWSLLEHVARVAGLALRRDDTAVTTCVRIEFPQTIDGLAIGLGDAGPATAAAAAGPAAPLAGRQLLVVAARRETRNGIRETLRPTAATVDYVASVDEARDFCSQSMPHAIVYEAALAGDTFRALRREWTAAEPALVFVEIAEHGRGVEVHELDGERTTRIGRDMIARALPGALLLEWTQPA
jgi:hypothetical protein